MYIYVLGVAGSFQWLFLSKFILIVQLILLDLSSLWDLINSFELVKF
jgi:hypothetical protein